MTRGNRREFLKRAGVVASGAALGAAGCKGGGGAAGGGASVAGGGGGGGAAPVASITHDLCIAKGSETIADLTRAAVDGLGGMAAFVGEGATVCLKPNASWQRAPGIGATTHPDVLKAVADMCLEAGAGEVFAIDFPLNPKPLDWNGLGDAITGAGGRFIELNDSTDPMWEPVDFVDGVKALPGLGEEQVAFDLLQADVVINMPVLKTHSSTGLSLSLKNLMGVIRDRGRYHGGGGGGYSGGTSETSNELDQAIADLGLMLKEQVQLTVVDCSYVLTHDSGPMGREDIDGEPMMTCIAGVDMVACDQKAAEVFGMTAEDIRAKVPHIHLAEEIGVGTTDLSTLNVNEVDLASV